jgi:hypothetical protein
VQRVKCLFFPNRRDLYFFGADFAKGGPIGTLKEYDTRASNLAYLFEDGKVRRHNKVIGTREQIELLAKGSVTIEEFESRLIWPHPLSNVDQP